MASGGQGGRAAANQDGPLDAHERDDLTEIDRALLSLAPEGHIELDENRVWAGVEERMGRESSGWLRGPLAGLRSVWRDGSTRRRVGLAAIGAVTLVAVALLVPAFPGGGTADAAVLEAARELSDSTEQALSDDTISSDELAELRRLAQRLLDAITEDPDALGKLNQSELASVIGTLRAVGDRLVLANGDSTSAVAVLGSALLALGDDGAAGDLDDGAAGDVDDGADGDVDDGAAGDVDDGAVGDVDDGAAGDGDDGAAGDRDDGAAGDGDDGAAGDGDDGAAGDGDD